MDKIRRTSERGDSGRWLGNTLDLHRDLDALARKGLIDENRWRRISISDGKTK